MLRQLTVDQRFTVGQLLCNQTTSYTDLANIHTTSAQVVPHNTEKIDAKCTQKKFKNQAKMIITIAS